VSGAAAETAIISLMPH